MSAFQTATIKNAPDFILYAQHGWADNAIAIASLTHSLATPRTKAIVPDLGWFKTWLRIEPLIQNLEGQVKQTLIEYPQTPLRIIGHSMGGLIWLELLHRHPEWRSRVHSLILVASPVGGADLARIIDPFRWGIGIARDLGTNRRAIAESIAAEIPTLVIAGDIDNGSDGTIPLGSTQCARTQFIRLEGVSHPQLKNSPQLVPLIRNFWKNPVLTPAAPPDVASPIIERLRAIPGMTDAHPRHFSKAKRAIALNNGLTLRTWKNGMGIEHIFLANATGECLYSGFVGWSHSQSLAQTLAEFQTKSR
ncbi:alpha/beta fold hydrolase [Lusitaniella coriacea]|uniref:alpha/beta fold hydrolase n=1 Tax=Lusitaniella coriacea TaxID=1983105 RepID=UPI003CF39023